LVLLELDTAGVGKVPKKSKMRGSQEKMAKGTGAGLKRKGQRPRGKGKG
jgi:hypothetical protein